MRIVLWVVTLLRVVLLPFFVVFGLRAQNAAAMGADTGSLRMIVVIVLLTIGLSDIVDGWIARRFELATDFGAFMDAAADKLVQVTVVTFFTFSEGGAFGMLPLWFLILLVGRDLILGIGWAAIRARTDLRVVHRSHGRLGSVGVFVLVVWLAMGLPQVVVTPLLLATTLVIVRSTVGYSRDGLAQLPGRAANGP